MKLSEDIKHIFKPTLSDSRPLVGDDCFKDISANDCVWRFMFLIQINPYRQMTSLLVVFDSVLNQIEDDELIEPPVSANRHIQPIVANKLNCL